MEVGWVCQSSVGAAGVGWGVKEGNRRAEGKKLLAGCVWGSCIMGWNLVGRKRETSCAVHENNVVRPSVLVNTTAYLPHSRRC